MIQIYKKYHIAYWTIGILCIIAMLVLDFLFPKLIILWFLLIAVCVVIDASVFMRLASKKLSDEVIVLYNDCRVQEYIDSLYLLMGNSKGVAKSIFNYLLASGYALQNDYDKVYECCKYITHKAHKTEYHLRMIDYYLNKEQPDLAEKEIEELKKRIAKVRNAKYKSSLELSVKSAEYGVRIKRGDYEGAEEFYLGVLASPNCKYRITKTSYSFALAKLLMLKGDNEGARQYLQVSLENAGDTKYKEFSEKRLAEIDQIIR